MAGFQSNHRTRTRGVPRKLRSAVMRRARGQCEKRGPNCTLAATQVDHVIPVSEGGDDSLTNLEATCDNCHKPKTQAEAQRARARYSRRRPPAPRPGLRPGSSPFAAGYHPPHGDPLPDNPGPRTA